MARKTLTREEEQALIDEAWAHRGDETYWDFEHVIAGRPRRATLPVKLDIDGDLLAELNVIAIDLDVDVTALISAVLRRFAEDVTRADAARARRAS